MEDMREEMEGWTMVRSLGWRVSVEVARDFHHIRLKGEVEGFGLDKGVDIICFKEAGETDIVLHRPWVVAGQALEIRSALVWVWLSWLSMEFWGEAVMRGVLWLAGELLSVDDCTVERKRLGFARACVTLDLSRPLRPGVRIMGPDGPFWKRFIYENLDGVCLQCGHFHHSKEQCLAGGEGGGEERGLG